MAELDLGSVIGPQGPIGPKGDTGAQGSTGATGATGAKGDTGQRGSLWYNGTGITGTSTTATVFSGSGVTAALVNDYYQNTGTGADRGRVYRCTVAGAATVAKWVYAGTNLGPQGDQGIQGETGATGATGPKGDTGATGATGPKGDKGDKGDKGNTGATGPNAANLISATDVQGLVGTAGGSSTVQLLINSIADKVANKLLLKTDVVSQIVNDAAKAASMAALYSVNQKVDTVNSNLAGVSNNLNNKFDTSRIRTAAGVFNDTSINQLFNISGSSSGNTYLLAAQIQLSTGTWSDLRTMDGITRIDCNTLQVNVIKSSAAIYAGYYVRFVLLD